MSTIEKMLIKGIRSFSPDNQNVIEFYKPLTLIVGQNGAGKTTVIECLKQACTGELPPNTRSGQSFIHDPKVAHDSEVKAQIKLRFNTSTGQPVVVMRSFQLTQKKTNMQFKTLDSVVQTINRETGEKKATTYRCTDIDKMVPALMGVSKAVLENVIFVHQEDSNWPLAEGKTLKDKFDDIFSATKYTKAVEALRKLRQEKVVQVREMKLKLEHLRTNREHAFKLRRDVSEGQATVDGFSKSIDELEGLIRETEDQADDVDAKLSTLVEIGRLVDNLSAKHSMLVESTDEKRSKLSDPDAEESSEEMAQYLVSLDAQNSAFENEIGRLNRDITMKRTDKDSMQDKYQKECLLHGRLTADASMHATNVGELCRFTTQSAAKLSLPAAPVSGLEGTALLRAVDGYRAEVEAKRQAVESNLLDTKQKARSTDDKMSDAVDRTTAEISRSTESSRLKREQLQGNERTIEDLHLQMQSMIVNMEAVSDAQQQAEELRQRVAGKQAESQRLGLDTQVAQERAAIEEIQSRISLLRQERERVASANESRTRLKLKRQELMQREDAVASLVAGKRSRLIQLLHGDSSRGGSPELPPLDELRPRVERALAEKRQAFSVRGSELKQAQESKANAQASLRSTESQLANVEAQLGRLRNQLRDGMRQSLDTVCEENQYPTLFEESTKALDSKRSKKVKLESSQKLLQHYRDTIAKGSCCPTCNRGFAGANEISASVEFIRSEIQQLPMILEEYKRSCEVLEKQVEGLQTLNPLWVRFSDLRDKEIASLHAKRTTEQERCNTLFQNLDEMSEVYALEESELQEAAKLSTETVWQVDRTLKELAEIKAQVHSLESLMGRASQARTVSDVDYDLERLEEEKVAHERTKDDISRRITRNKDEQLALATEYATARDEFSRMQQRLAKKTEMANKVAQLDDTNQQLQLQMQRLQQEQQPLAQRKEALVAEREGMRREAQAQESVLEEQLRGVQQLLDQLVQKYRPVRDYVNGRHSQEMQRVNDSMAAIKQKIEANSNDLARMEGDLVEKRHQFAERDTLRRNVADMLDYRRSCDDRDAIASELQAEQRRQGTVGDPQALQSKLEKLGRQRDELRRKQDHMRGQTTAAHQGIQRAKQELSAAAYIDVEGRYKQLAVEVTTNEMANNDLDKYNKALEKALLAFHTTKMSDINKIIKELWQKTYRGQDIDYIQVKADADGTKSYNYRVVMFNNGAELEMRGRCSAGQKVLACLVIRLALAEAFCLNCGILALDEPTTNLDADNSASLAEALRAIMVSRAGQENFQLIIITHDEAFAHAIGTREQAEFMWRITKDDNQHTHIAQEDIDDS